VQSIAPASFFRTQILPQLAPARRLEVLSRTQQKPRPLAAGLSRLGGFIPTHELSANRRIRPAYLATTGTYSCPCG
jgi:hypothetical protein